MFKIRIKSILLFTFLFSSVVYANTANIDTSKVDQGIVNVSYASNQKTKVIISKGSDKYTYDLNSKGQFPLQMGSGQYTVGVFENISGNQYKAVASETVNVKAANANGVYLESIDMIKWNNDMKAIKKAKELTKDAKTDKEKATILYNFVTKQIKYDYAKANSVAAGYLPSIDGTLNSSLGICYDYASLYAGMLRSVGVPTKLIMGYKSDMDEYHAWNQVYLSESNQWVTIDTTYDAPSIQAGIETKMIKNNSEYKIEKQF